MKHEGFAPLTPLRFAFNVLNMSTVAEIKAAIDRLSPQERCELEALLHPFEDDDWDRQMKADAAAGKFDEMHRQADAEHAAGKTIPLHDILNEP